MMHGKSRILLAVLACVGILAGSSCGKDDITELSYEYISGSLSFSLPDYVSPNTEYTAVPAGVYRSDGGDFGYYWVLSTSGSVRDTTKWEGDGPTVSGAYSFRSPSSLETFTLSGTVYAYNHVGSTFTKTMTVVDPSLDGSLKGRDFGPDAQTYTDDRDARVYRYRRIASLDWMLQNLAYTGAGVTMANCEVMNDPYGRYYTWDEAKTVCPAGWRLPSGADWDTLAASLKAQAGGTYKGIAGELMSNATFNGSRMWDYWPAVKITNETHFCAVPTGYAIVDGNGQGTFFGNLEYAAFWTSDSYNDEQGVYRYIFASRPDVMVGNGHKDSFAASVRCVRDAE